VAITALTPPPPGTSLASPDGKNCERRYFDAIVPYDDNLGNKTGKYSPLVKDWASMQCLTNYAIVSLRINPIYALQSQGLVKVGVTVRDRMAGWIRGAGRVAAGVPGRRGL